MSEDEIINDFLNELKKNEPEPVSLHSFLYNNFNHDFANKKDVTIAKRMVAKRLGKTIGNMMSVFCTGRFW